ncbi:hypothetical protein B1207_09765 [Legionella quinlivanii]|uniref:Coiled-coil protein n=1 Tax=Legionella quinlivanii TaxID=45073 RepID=A0A364LJ51_9GAMM|nr:hypothetical protein [Legionella quinlivanii]RAP36414.1 hypothetical protein B1207_09765 [Legionella quinlivanii]
MANLRATDDHLQIAIPLTVKPVDNETATVSSLTPKEASLLYGHYSMDYRIPGGILRLLARHDNKTMQILLMTEDTALLQEMPGERPSSLIANTISRLNGYFLHADSYDRPLSIHQKKKIQLTQNCIKQLSLLLEEERQIQCEEWSRQEDLRIKVLAVIEACQDGNILLANHPAVSEGTLGKILFHARDFAQRYEFNRVFPVSRIDQHDFSRVSETKNNPCFIWDSETHLENGDKEELLKEALWVISRQYGFNEANELNQIDANRFKRLETFLRKRWQDIQKWVDYLALPHKPEPKLREEKRLNGISTTSIEPYYFFEGVGQQAHLNLHSLVESLVNSPVEIAKTETFEQAEELLWTAHDGSWVRLAGSNSIVLRKNNRIRQWHYFKENECYYILPTNQDLLTLMQLSKRHLYFPERAKLTFKAFLVNVPRFFKFLYTKVYAYITETLKDDFSNHLHSGHPQLKKEAPPSKPLRVLPAHLRSLQDILQGQGLLANGETLEEFVKRQIHVNQYVIARAEHLPSPPPYNNPFHRVLGVLRHFSALFIDISEQNPIIGSLALAAYIYGAGAVAAPELLKSILAKLHLNGLIYGIEPTQALGRWMSHGTVSEAISAAVTYWQGVIVGGDLDQFFIKAVSVLKDEPAQVAIIISLALGLGYGLCKTFPAIEKEMGTFPWPNRLAVGGKFGAASFDTIMHPGDDWLLGTIKWLLHGGFIFLKIALSPFIEWRYYGFKNGFGSGLGKSLVLTIQTAKEIAAGSLDFTLALLTIPFMELSALFIHVPFRGITSLVSKTLGALGNVQAIGQSLSEFAERKTGWNYLSGFRLSPLYGFSNPIQRYSNNTLLNLLATLVCMVIIPVFQLLKNLIILPLLDLTFLGIRLSLTLIDPISRLAAFMLGKTLFYTGYVSDYTIGYLLRLSATIVTKTSNLIDQAAGFSRQLILKEIQLGRHALFHWAFAAQDAAVHQPQTDFDYFQEDVMRIERLEDQDSTQCLLEMLIDDLPKAHLSKAKDDTPCNRLFHKSAEQLHSAYTLNRKPPQAQISTSDYQLSSPVF